MRPSNPADREAYPESKSTGETKRIDTSRVNEGNRIDQRRRSVSPTRPSVEGNQDSRRREEERGAERRSAREEARRAERRSGREDDRERDREKDRRGERDRERDREGSRRDRDSTARATGSRVEESNHVPGSPHRADDTAGRKRTRDPKEEDVGTYECLAFSLLTFDSRLIVALSGPRANANASVIKKRTASGETVQHGIKTEIIGTVKENATGRRGTPRGSLPEIPTERRKIAPKMVHL